MAKEDTSKPVANAPAVAEPAVAQPPAPLPPLVASSIPQIEKKEDSEIGIDINTPPKDEEFTDGIYEMDGEPYALCIHEPDGYGNTHTLKNSAHFWQGKESAFNEKFTRP